MYHCEDMSTEFSALVEHSMQIASKQYDMEIEIYQNIWKTFYDLSMCQKYIYHFENTTQADSDAYLLMLRTFSVDIESKFRNVSKANRQCCAFLPKRSVCIAVQYRAGIY